MKLKIIILLALLFLNKNHAQKVLKFDKIFEFKNNFALVSKGNNSGFIDIEGKLVTKMNLDKYKVSGMNGYGIFIETGSLFSSAIRNLEGNYLSSKSFSITELKKHFILKNSPFSLNRKIIILNKKGNKIFEENRKSLIENYIIPISDTLLAFKEFRDDSNFIYKIKNIKSGLETPYTFYKPSEIINGYFRLENI